MNKYKHKYYYILFFEESILDLKINEQEISKNTYSFIPFQNGKCQSCGSRPSLLLSRTEGGKNHA